VASIQGGAFIHTLSLNGTTAWWQYCAGDLEASKGLKPDDIPSNPQKAYENKGWISWSDWMGYAQPSNGGGISDGTCNFTQTGDQSGIDPLLGPLQDNGGPTFTHALLAGSPAVDHIPLGVNGCGEPGDMDQRGVARPQGPNCDIGAYDLQSDPATLIQELMSVVINLNIHAGIANSLDAKLNAAIAALDDVNENNDVAAVGSMQAFINAVEAQRGNKISPEDADSLIAKAQTIIDLILSS
jgi:hypothetical protein